jgi:hypothetical protein
MIIDPERNVLASLGLEEGVAVAEINLAQLGEVRERLPCLRMIYHIAHADRIHLLFGLVSRQPATAATKSFVGVSYQ